MNDAALVIEDIILGLPIRDGRTLPYRRKRCKIFITVLRVTPINLAVSSVVFRMPEPATQFANANHYRNEPACFSKSITQDVFCSIKDTFKIYFCH